MAEDLYKREKQICIETANYAELSGKSVPVKEKNDTMELAIIGFVHLVVVKNT